LPRRFADSRPVDGGRTSLMVLVDQLDLLGATMDQVFDAVCRDDATALVAHGRFLEEKFGHASTGGELNVGTSYAVPPPPGMLGETPAAPESTPAAPPAEDAAAPTAAEPAPAEHAASAGPEPKPATTADPAGAAEPVAADAEPLTAEPTPAPPGTPPGSGAPEPAPPPAPPARSMLDLDSPDPGSPEPQRLAPPSWP
jgi:hypothetical protein